MKECNCRAPPLFIIVEGLPHLSSSVVIGTFSLQDPEQQSGRTGFLFVLARPVKASCSNNKPWVKARQHDNAFRNSGKGNQGQHKDYGVVQLKGYQFIFGAFSKQFLDQVTMTEEWWGPLIPAKLKGKPKEELEQGHQKFIACLFLAATDRSRYNSVINDLSNDFHKGHNNYPTDIPGMVRMLTTRCGNFN